MVKAIGTGPGFAPSIFISKETVKNFQFVTADKYNISAISGKGSPKVSEATDFV